MKEIKKMYNQLRPKSDFIRAAAKKFGVAQSTVRMHWISNDSVPKDKEEEVKELIRIILHEQKEYEKKIGL